MATYGELKTRIIAETTRDDLADDYAVNLTQAIVEAIDTYASQRFWFNELRATSVTVAGNEYAAVPTGLRWIDSVSVLVGVGYRLVPDSLDNIEDLSRVGGNGQPTRYARYAPSGADQLRLYPTPTAAWTLVFIGTSNEPVLSAAGDTNAWTVNAYDLIAARAKFLLCRDLFRDDMKMQTAQAAEAQALTRLRAETGRRTATGRIRASFP